MEYDSDESQDLARRLRDVTGDLPPWQVFHAFALLAGTDPEHLAGTYQPQSSDRPARWHLAAFSSHNGLLCVVDATGRGSLAWDWQSSVNRPSEIETMTARAWPLRQIERIEVSDIRSRAPGDDKPSPNHATATWSVRVQGENVPPPDQTDRSDAEQIAQSLRDSLRNS